MGVTASTASEHRYQLCEDESCERFPCRVYKDGWRDGHAAGFAAGYADGHAGGYSEGYGDGCAAGAEG
jgi:hypothetical protein